MKNPKWFNLELKEKKEIQWLSEPLKGKMKGIQQAAKLYEMSFKYPEYKRLTILDLLDRLKESDEKVIENAAWMLLKIVHLDSKLLFQNLNVIKSPIKLKNKKIRLFLGSIIKHLANIDSSRVQSAIPAIVELLDDSDDDIKLLASQIFLIISKNVREKIEVSKQLALLNEKNQQIRLNAIETLVNISESKTTIPILYEKLFMLILYPQLKARVFNLIFQLINKDPDVSVEFITNQLAAKKIMIRRNALIFLTQFIDKKLDYLTRSINDLVNLLEEEYDKTNLKMNLSILKELSEFYPQKFNDQQLNKIIENEKKFKKELKRDWVRIILNLFRNNEKDDFDFNDIKKYLEKEIKKGDYSRRANVAISLNRILMWNDDYGPALKHLLEVINKYPLEDNGEIYFWIGYNYHVIGDFKASLTYFQKGLKSKNEYHSNLSLLFTTYAYILNFKLKKAKEFLEENLSRWDKNLKNLSLVQKGILLRFHEYLNSLIKLEFNRAENNLKKYLSTCYFQHSWDVRFQEVELKNLNDIVNHYQKLEKLNE
ncbi:MAG: hypothetical protein ACTSVY_02210 [Candidatus Helarchaeota archaeon]